MTEWTPLKTKQIAVTDQGLVAVTECGKMFLKEGSLKLDGDQKPEGSDWCEIQPVTADHCRYRYASVHGTVTKGSQ